MALAEDYPSRETGIDLEGIGDPAFIANDPCFNCTRLFCDDQAPDCYVGTVDYIYPPELESRSAGIDKQMRRYLAEWAIYDEWMQSRIRMEIEQLDRIIGHYIESGEGEAILAARMRGYLDSYEKG